MTDNIQATTAGRGAAVEADLSGVRNDNTTRMFGRARGETTDICLRDGRGIRTEIANLRMEWRTP